jgi:phage terminase large subunit-like protein
MSEYTYQKYISDVKSNKITVCKAIKKAVKRHLSDLKKAEEKDYPYYFNEKEAQKVIHFFSFLKCNEGQFFGKTIELLPWQQWIVAMIFGWRSKETNFRRYRKAYVQVGKKSGKSTLMAGLQLYGMLEENGAQCYTVSGKREQAALVFNYATDMIKKSVDLKDIFVTKRNQIESTYKGRTGIFKALASDYNTSDGLNASFLVIDEYFSFPHSKLVNAVESGMIMRQQPLSIYITTAGGKKSGPCFELYQHLQKVLDGTITDESFFGAIYELDKDDSWKDITKYLKALPSLGYLVTTETLQDKLKLAQALAGEEYEFRGKILNQWIDFQDVWIENSIWKKNQIKFDKDELKGKTCYAAIDLSKVRDLTSFTLCFPPDSDYTRYRVLHYCFIPDAQVASKQQDENIMFRRWIDDGLVIATPGQSVDYDYVFEQVVKASELYNIKEIAFDPYCANVIDERLTREGFVTVEVKQGLSSFSPITKAWEIDVIKSRIADTNPIMEWCLSNVVVKVDVNGNYKPLKANESDKSCKIDLVVSSIMAHSRCNAIREEQESESYTESDFMFYEDVVAKE